MTKTNMELSGLMAKHDQVDLLRSIFAGEAGAGRNRIIILVLDGAGWHNTYSLAAPENLTPLPLAPYSPEINPVERVWLYLRERFLSLRLLSSTEAIIDACCDAWMRLVAEPGRIKSLYNNPWIEKVASQTQRCESPGVGATPGQLRLRFMHEVA